MNERERLSSLYENLSNEELVQIGSQFESLTSEAQLLLREEFNRRSLAAPVLEERPDSFEFQELVTVRRFFDLSDAAPAKSVLDSAGIPCLLKDENTVRIQWGWANLLGGIRLQVHLEDLKDAENLLSQPIPETIEFGEGKSYQQPRCPHCQSPDIGPRLMIVTGKWICNKCGQEWEDGLTSD